MWSDDRYYRTTSFYEGVWLYAMGMELANVDKVTDEKRATFVFVDTPERPDLVRAFNYGKEDSKETLLDGRKLIAAIRQLKEKLYQSNF